MSEQLTNTVSTNLAQESTIADTFAHLDFYGVALIIIAIALLVIAYVLINLSRKINTMQVVPQANPIKSEKNISVVRTNTQSNPDEVHAVIALALHFYENDLHDTQNAVLTINRVAKFYSPWSSKIYGLSKNPR
jgi:Na+-transporting methylmalonyl-CoA/oxaloacetate decarboxylase gamma subunit